MSNDETELEVESSDEAEPIEDDLEEDGVDEGALVDDDAVDEVVLLEDSETVEDDLDEPAAETDADGDSDTEALDDLEAEELEMLTEDEASETIVVDEETQLRDIRRAQISIEASSVGGPDADEFVCSVCFLVKKSSQLSSRRKKMCLDCAG